MASWLRQAPLVAAVAILAGCTTSGEESTTAARVLGDFATIQPCSLTSLEVFDEFGSAEFGTPGSLDHCTVVVKPDASETVSLKRNVAEEVTIVVGELLRPSDDIPFLPTAKLEDVTDSIYTTQPDDVGVSCWQTLVFAEDDLALSVRSSLSPTASPFPTCDMVAAGMAKVVEVIQAGEVEHRSPEPNSLVSLDPCDLVDDETVAALPGFAEAQRVDSPGRHQCYWRTSTGMDGLRVTVSFGVAEPPEPRSSLGFDVNADPIAGRQSVTTYVPSSSKFCIVETGHIPFEEVAGATGLVEVVEVKADLPPGQSDPTGQLDEPDRVKAACEGALAVAKELWPRLPSA
jgi:hypothetical protein